MKPDMPKLSVRLDLPGGQRFGPGKAALLGAIAANGSISAAARALGMSYPRALRLIGEMNVQFKKPLVETHQGGPTRGGANLTPLGSQILTLYEELTRTAADASAHVLMAFAAQAASPAK